MQERNSISNQDIYSLQQESFFSTRRKNSNQYDSKTQTDLKAKNLYFILYFEG
jgi:hypothetical protein